MDALRARFGVVHVRGKGNLDPALQDVPGYWQLDYLHDEMADALWLADLVIERAGATTLAELEALGKRAVLVPLPATVSRGDQLDNAAAYARRHPGRCVVVPDDDRLHDGASLATACMELATDLGRTHRERPRPEVIHRAADLIAQETVACGQAGPHPSRPVGLSRRGARTSPGSARRTPHGGTRGNADAATPDRPQRSW
ncbi:glycosyltransferase [Streptomyces sp. NPDC059396]|uniref:glycosyltransferase n=1 Tax=Streptomyces sp. NPDC059396 TaxID=3346819 RepID=UPI0036736D23